MTSTDYQEIPDHVRRIIARDGQIEFTPPSFERWLGRLQMVRTLAAMAAFLIVWLASYSAGYAWESATVRGIVASLVFFFFAWAAGLFVFGEMYSAEVTAARADLEAKERERTRRVEEYYRERLHAQDEPEQGAGATRPMSAGPTPSYQSPAIASQPVDYQRRAA